MKLDTMLAILKSAFSSNSTQQPPTTFSQPSELDQQRYELYVESAKAVAKRNTPGTFRTHFSTTGSSVYGYPSTGGIFIKKDVDVMEMEFLSVPRTVAVNRSLDHAEEDAFCERLRRVGATWWAYDDERMRNYE